MKSIRNQILNIILHNDETSNIQKFTKPLTYKHKKSMSTTGLFN